VYHGGKISQNDFDTGHFDTPAILLQLNMAFAETGEVNEKGDENELRKDFKRSIAADLSGASQISIAAEEIPVITVSPDPAHENVVIVIVHILENLREKRGPDECWELAKKLCEQSSDTSSVLFQGDITKQLSRDGARLEKERERTGMTLSDFTSHATSMIACLSLWHVFVLRAYTSDTYPLFNNPMRSRIKPHPLKFTIFFLDRALKMLTTVEAKLRPELYNTIKYLWRGMRSMTIDTNKFAAEGGTELAPMSTTEALETALGYSRSEMPLIFRFEARGRSTGVNIGFLSLYPKEKEYLYAPLTGLVLLQVQQKSESELQEMDKVVSVEHDVAHNKEELLKAELRRIQEELLQLSERTRSGSDEQIFTVLDVRPMR